ncbi:CvpA family protein [Blastopirellula sp. JC732]|uniref:CvpA family protein n=1 Tax=Blastopirellula sediminis TaxID=2894196 RepID=A0A9X1MSA3_9BACT|nr:CvpA family protein [Blastopirellula sediminis]MCC9605138.1 CvpA family protein [Blastopirellula sediminis]MCC9631562.1 CvpA family protein [Blastopirellula sediminis]
MANGYDVLMVIVLLGATAWGLYKGMAWQLASFASIFASYVLSVQLREPVAALFPLEAPWNKLAAMLALYVGCSLVVWVGFRLISKSIESMKLKDFDRQVGALLGAAKGALLCIIITMFAVAFATGDRRQEIVTSKSGYYISRVIDKAQAIMPQEVHAAVKPYIDNFQQQIGDQPPITTANILPGVGQEQTATTGAPATGQQPTQFQPVPQEWQQTWQQTYGQLKADYGQIQGAVDQALQNPQQSAQPYVNQFQQNLRDQVQREIDQRWGAASQGYQQQPTYSPQPGYQQPYPYQQQNYAPQPTYPQQPQQGYYPQGYLPQPNGTQYPRY